ncbi:MAG TPA: RdgB/HAM1 family non-canonical purine NTP pyrophosphatase [Acidobacteriaceae bacterium]|jgi:XTP/dITP diphosphohydrolase|nr:RdgB/HAM1 family non-canonical purine NTP pyrophosphatase [Acidobacteriaceae bacterium]
MPPILCAATSNPGKLRDFSVAAAQDGIRIQPLPGHREIPAPDENQSSFEGNARLKAEYYSRFTPDMVLADDSGLEVDALGGEPGVRSARFAEDSGYQRRGTTADLRPLTTDERNNLCLLERMSGIEQRAARYRCVLALAHAGKVLLTAEGVVEGQILRAPQGSGGFGYDPLFWLPQLHRTMAEISLEEKHTLSHRGRAFRALLPDLRRLLPESPLK